MIPAGTRTRYGRVGKPNNGVHSPWINCYSWVLPTVACLGFIVLLLLTLLLPPAANAQNASELMQKRRQVKQLALEKAQIQEKLAYFKASETQLREEIGGLKEMINASHKRMLEMKGRVKKLSVLIGRQQAMVKRQQNRINYSRIRLRGRLLRLFRLTKKSHLSTLFQTVRYKTMARDSHYLALLQESDRQAVEAYEALYEDMKTKKEEVQHSLQQMKNLDEEVTEETRQLTERETFLKESLKDLANNKRMYTKYLQDLEKMMEGLEVAIKKLEKGATALKPPQKAPSPSELKGRMPLPAKGRVIARFGEQDPRYDLKKRQRGVVLRVAENTDVKATAGGRAVHAGPFRGYQELIVLDHGKGLFTVYGHLKELTVRRGQWVPPGTVLGRPTLQSVEEAHDVYFEIRYQGKPENPKNWLKPGLLK